MLPAMPERCLNLMLGAGQSVPSSLSWRVENGYLRASSWTDQAEIFTIGIWGPGEAVIPGVLTMQPVALQALSPASLSEWSPEEEETSAFATTHIRQMGMLLQLSRIRPAEMRLFNLLIWLGERFGQTTTQGLHVPIEMMNLTHRQLAEMASMSRVTVTKTLGQFRQQGWLIREGSAELVTRSALALHRRLP
jgi:hypothetical protein